MAKHPEGAKHKDAHRTVRPFLFRLLNGSQRGYQQLALAVLAASLDDVPLEPQDASLVANRLAALWLQLTGTEGILKWSQEDSSWMLKSSLPTDSHQMAEDLLVCLAASIQIQEQNTADESGRLDASMGSALFVSAGQVFMNTSAGVSLQSRLVSIMSLFLMRFPPTDRLAHLVPWYEHLADSLVRAFCANQSELKFQVLVLIVDFMRGIPCVKTVQCINRIHPNLRLGMLDILRSRAQEPMFAVLRCVTEVTSVLRSVGWMCKGPSDGFFQLLLGLVGVEVSMAFDTEQVDSQMLMACVEVLELVMQSLGDDDDEGDDFDEGTKGGRLMIQDHGLSPQQLLDLRVKLNDICRVPMEYLICFASSSSNPEDLRPQVATRIVSTWLMLDPDAIKKKEAIALIPQAVARLPWFLPVLSECWLSESEIRDAFLSENGLQRVAMLVEKRIVHVSQLVLSGAPDEMELWDSVYWVNPLDSIISACSVMITCCSVKLQRQIVLANSFDLLQQLLQAARMLLGRKGSADASILVGFVVAVMAQIMRITTTKIDPCHSVLVQGVATVVALYLPVAIETGGLSTLEAVADAMESFGDLFRLAQAIRTSGIDNLLQDALERRGWTVEQRKAANRVLSNLPQ